MSFDAHFKAVNLQMSKHGSNEANILPATPYVDRVYSSNRRLGMGIRHRGSRVAKPSCIHLGSFLFCHLPDISFLLYGTTCSYVSN
jgi:hypothetical protein